MRLGHVDTSGLQQSIDTICALVDRLRAEKVDLLEALQGVSLRRVSGALCWCEHLREPEHSAACLAARAAVAKIKAGQP